MIKDGGVLTTCQVFLLKALKTVQPLQALNSQSRWLVVVVVQYPCYKIFKIVVVVLVGSLETSERKMMRTVYLLRWLIR